MKNGFKILVLFCVMLMLTLALFSCTPPEGNGDGCTHEVTEMITQKGEPATCTEVGVYDEVVICSSCKTELSRERTFVDPLGHNMVTHEAKAPTCTEGGYDAYVTCSRCDYSTKGEELSPVNHTIVSHEAKAATCTEAGHYAYETCSECSYTTYVEIPALEHNIINMFGTNPTCTTPGCHDYEYCDRCDYSTYVEIPALDHILEYGEAQPADCESFGNHAYEYCLRGGCDYNTYYDNLISPLGHDEIFHEAKIPNCTEGGWDSYYTCSRCDYETPHDTYDDPRHDLEYVAMSKAATCTEPGWESPYDRCTKCDYKDSNYVEIPALGGHDIQVEKAKERTCTEGGWDAYNYCTRCDYDERVLLGPLGHDIVNHEAKAPSCEQDGWKAYETCSRCNEINTYEVDPLLGHNRITVASKEATCEEDGFIEYECERCSDYHHREERPRFGHDWGAVGGVEPTCTTIGSELVEYCKRCYLIETGSIAPTPEILKTLPHSFVDGECTVCHNREGSIGLEFEVAYDGKSYAVVGLGSCTEGVIVIPSTYNGLPVIEVAQGAFANERIVSIYLPSTLDASTISIEAGAFMNCYNLVEIINNSGFAFDSFGYQIAEWIIAKDNEESKIVKDGDYYFYVDGNEATLISYVGDGTDITLPESYNGNSYKIHNNAFRETGITSIVIPKSVTEIGAWALHTAESLKCVTVNYVGTKDEWKEIKVDSTNNQWIKEFCYHHGTECDSVSMLGKAPTCTEWGYSAYTTECSMCGKIEVNKVEIEPTGHNYVGVTCTACGDTLPESEGLKYELVEVEDGQDYYIVTGIGTCTDEYVVIPSTYNGLAVKAIASNAFRDSVMKGVIISDNITSIGVYAFYNCDNLVTVVIPDSVISISNFAFQDCDGVKTVIVGSGVAEIGFDAFKSCDTLASVTIGDGVTLIKDGAFDNCDSLTDVYYAGSETEWNKITKTNNDDSLKNAEIHFNCKNI